MKATLVLADGESFVGSAMGATGEKIGEVVFNTAITGYQEVLTDPSYRGQIVTMTYPHIGNTGVNFEDNESAMPFLAGFVVKEYCASPSNWRKSEDLDAFLKRFNIIGIQGIDTRRLTRNLRETGAKKGIISTEDHDPDNLLKKVRNYPDIEGLDLVKEVTCDKPYDWSQGTWRWNTRSATSQRNKFKVAALDCGIKQNILRLLVDSGAHVRIFPAFSTSEQILAYNPDGIFLSNGPGDPEGVPYVVETVRNLIGKKPIFGICLGHQIIGLALRGRVYKLTFGHHGANHPVRRLDTGQVEITSQNHNFAVDPETVASECVVTHVNLNDQTNEGMVHKKYPLFSIQYHPEASPGPHDSRYLFERFRKMIMDS
ncbi:MAG: glutamine-hydrolyzing carbamoyl-phosphate synthase small subunit [Deltaproteobacteria bacterium]|nr:glutamine-hydrolyzing carbamoyl-phosphate synthase small subunit [Deltaproteobacteria bacterium]